MNQKIFVYSVGGLLTSGALAGLLISHRTQAQSMNPDPNRQHSSQQAPASQGSMMTRPDQHFIEMMIPQGQDAVEMATLALKRAKRPEIKNLATTTKQGQTRAIQQMRDWYKAWYGKDVPQVPMATSMMGNHQSMGQGRGQGMMTQNGMMHTDLTALKNASDFDKEFIRQMITHHQMAVRTAQMVLNQKPRPEIRTLAQSIIKNKTAEINQMQQWQQAWFR